MLKFIQDLKIESGTDSIPTYLIFYYYRSVWKEDVTKAKKITFFQNFNKHFPTRRIGTQRFYMIKPGIFDLTLKEAARQYDKQFWSKKETRPKKVSILEENRDS